MSDKIDPWDDFLRARRKAMIWMRDEMKYDNSEIAIEFSVNIRQVQLILNTPIEEEDA